MESGKDLAKRLLYKNESVAVQEPALLDAAQEFCQDYKAFLDASKTEREAAKTAVEMLCTQGYQRFDPVKTYAAGDKLYLLDREKCVLAVTLGTRPLEQGFRILVAHVDAPRLDLRPVPLYESGKLALFKTHYYGGIRKYQWVTIPLALHGVVYRTDGSRLELSVGEETDDPVFCITDLLPHLSAKQNERTLKDGVTAEELNLLIGSLPYADTEVQDRVKLNILYLLNRKYGLTERDFIRAELEIVPAFKARDVGFDRSMVGAYGQDDRVDAFPALRAEMECRSPAFTTVCIFTDKEEIGSDGVTGMNSEYAFNFLRQLCACQGADAITAFRASKCLSADVTAAYDPTWADAFEPQNGVYAGHGLALYKYTGARGKSGTSDACAELVAWVTDLLDGAGVVWQIGEMGKIDLGGGGTVAKYVAQHDIDVIDVGVPVLSMHSPFEVVSKADVYMAYRAFTAFLNTEK